MDSGRSTKGILFNNYSLYLHFKMSLVLLRGGEESKITLPLGSLETLNL